MAGDRKRGPKPPRAAPFAPAAVRSQWDALAGVKIDAGSPPDDWEDGDTLPADLAGPVDPAPGGSIVDLEYFPPDFPARELAGLELAVLGGAVLRLSQIRGQDVMGAPLDGPGAFLTDADVAELKAAAAPLLALSARWVAHGR